MTITIDPSLLALARTAVHQMDGLTLASLTARGCGSRSHSLEHQRGRRFRLQAIRLLAGRPRMRNHKPVATRKQEG